MTTESTLSVEERLYRLLRHLGIDQAHFAGRLVRDWSGLVAKYPQVISSLIVINAFDRRLAEPVSAKLLVLTGDRGTAAETVRSAMCGVTGVQHAKLSDYDMLAWSDVGGERTREFADAMLGFLRALHRALPSPLGCRKARAMWLAFPTAFAASALRSCCCRCSWRPRNGSL